MTNTTAVLNGHVNPNGRATDYTFSYGPTTAYGAATPAHSVGGGTKLVAVSPTIAGLTPGTVYHYRISAVNGTGSSAGADRTFTTTGPPPADVVTGPALNVGKTVATPTASINPQGAVTTWVIQYGLTPAYGFETFAQTLAPVVQPLAVSVQLAGLAPATLFHYHVVAYHGSGVVSQGGDATFFTEPSKRPAPKLTAHTSPGRDRRSPYRFTTTGSLGGAGFIPAAQKCTGNVGIRYYNGRRQLAFVVAPVGADCRFSAPAAFSPLARAQARGVAGEGRFPRQRVPRAGAADRSCGRRLTGAEVTAGRRFETAAPRPQRRSPRGPTARRSTLGLRAMPERGPRASPAEILLLAALVAWGAFPIVLLLTHAAQLHARFTGADGLIGADGVLGADQLQYLAWARDASAHGGLASDLFTLSPSGHVYLEPLFAITGALFRAGLSLPLAYLLWKPVAMAALFLAAVAWARRMFGDRLARRAAVVALSLFLFTPVTAFFSWTQLGGGSFRFSLFLLGDELLAASKLWGYVPSAIGLALVPAALLGVERALGPALGAGAPRAGRRGAVRPRPLALAAGAALVASWLHPWQGITLVLIFAGLAALQRGRHWVALAIPAIAAALPLAYYYLLSHHDPAWRLASQYEVIATFPPLTLLAGFAPLAAIAVLGVRRPDGVVIEQALLLWVGACFVTYFVNDAFAPHALQGLSFPLAVLMVRGWCRCGLAGPGRRGGRPGDDPRPGLRRAKFARTADSSIVQYYLPRPTRGRWTG